MRVGMIFECGPQGADGKVYPYLAKKIRPDLEIEPFFLDRKPRLIQECGMTAKLLLEKDKCARVMVIWDHRPFWGYEGDEPLCPVTDCQRMHVSLDKNLTVQQRENVRLLCVVHELETLLLFDKQALSTYLSKLTGRICNVKDFTHPERRINPKVVLEDLFTKKHKYHRKYSDLRDAHKLIELVDIDKLKHCPAFQKFKKRIIDL